MTERTPQPRPAIEPWLREILRCPAAHHRLADGADADGTPVLVCTQDCGEPGVRRSYRVEDGIPVLLVDEARIVRR